MQRYSSSASEPISAHPYPAVPKTVGLTSVSKLFLLPEVRGENIRKAVVDIEGRLKFNLRVDHAAIQLRRDGVGFPIHLGEVLADHLPVKVDGGDPPDIAFIGDLVAVSVEAVAHPAVGNGDLGASELGHVLERGGDALPSAVQADLAVHIDGQTVLCGADTLCKRFVLVEKVQQEPNHVGDLLAVFSGGDIDCGFILGFGHDLLAKIGVLHTGYIGISAQQRLRLIHEGLQLVLVSERFFQIHIVHSCRFIFSDLIVARGTPAVIEPLV